MPNIANLLRSEMSRLARKEARAETDVVRKLVAKHRSAIAELKRQVQTLDQQVRGFHKAVPKVARAPDNETPAKGTRFSAKGLTSQRRRLGLTAAECGLLLGTSIQTIYNWEQGAARPQAKHHPAISALKTLSKRAAREHLDSLKAAA